MPLACRAQARRVSPAVRDLEGGPDAHGGYHADDGQIRAVTCAQAAADCNQRSATTLAGAAAPLVACPVTKARAWLSWRAAQPARLAGG